MSSSRTSSCEVISGDELNEVCSSCGESLPEMTYSHHLYYNTVLHSRCQRCYPGHADLIFFDPNGPAASTIETVEEIRFGQHLRVGSGSPELEGDNEYPKQIVLDAEDLRRLEGGNVISLTSDDGGTAEYTVLKNFQRKIHIRKVHQRHREILEYEEVLRRNVVIMFYEIQDFEDWSNCFVLPTIVPSAETPNFQAFKRMVRLGHFETLRIRRTTSKSIIEFLIKQALLYGVKLLRKVQEEIDKVFSPVERFFVDLWKNLRNLFGINFDGDGAAAGGNALSVALLVMRGRDATTGERVGLEFPAAFAAAVAFAGGSEAFSAMGGHALIIGALPQLEVTP